MSDAYTTFIFIKDDSDFSLEAAAKKLGALTSVTIQNLRERGFTVCWENWYFEVGLADEPSVLEEHQEDASNSPNDPRMHEAASCRRRVEMWSPETDYDCDYLDEYLITLEVLTGFKGLLTRREMIGDWLIDGKWFDG